MRRALSSLLIWFGLLQLASAQSALRWDKKTVEVSPGQEEKTARADFNFTNVSKQAVMIESVKPSCGCTTAALEKKIFQPGEKGHITGVFTIGSHRGVQTKTISVNIKGERDSAVLTMVTNIGEQIKIDPPLVYWKTGDTPRIKSITVKGLRVVKVTCNDPRISAKLDTVKEGGEYRITVLPGDTAQKAMATLNIQCLTRANEPKNLQAYAQVR